MLPVQNLVGSFLIGGALNLILCVSFRLSLFLVLSAEYYLARTGSESQVCSTRNMRRLLALSKERTVTLTSTFRRQTDVEEGPLPLPRSCCRRVRAGRLSFLLRHSQQLVRSRFLPSRVSLRRTTLFLSVLTSLCTISLGSTLLTRPWIALSSLPRPSRSP